MSVIHEERSTLLAGRLYVFPVFLATVLTLAGFRLWYLQVAMEENAIEQAIRMRSSKRTLNAPRGLILDRSGMMLAKVKNETVINAIPRIVNKKPEILERLAKLLNVPLDQLKKRVADGNFRPAVPTPIFVGAPIEAATKIVEDPSLEGISVAQQPMRTYPDTLKYAHILGYVRAPGPDDVARLKKLGVEAAAYVGKQGLELKHELDLMGQNGYEEIEVDSANRPGRTVSVEYPQPGAKLVLGLDHGLQDLAWKEMAGRAGSVVAIDPQNGEILCMASVPSFDTSIYSGGLSSADLKALYDDPNAPMVNRAVATPTAPGSTFKIVTTLAAMRSGTFSPNWSAFCSGGTKVGNRFIKCTGNHGSVTFARGMQKSCNAYFIRLGLLTKMSNIGKVAHECGLGVRLNIDTTGERAGLIPDKDYMEKLKLKGPGWGWFDGHTANASIGQGEVNATPLQMANLAALVANNGIQYRPHFVHELVGVDGTRTKVKPEVINQIKLPVQDWQLLKRALTTVLEPGGTAFKLAHINGLSWGGKTGSAERRSNDPTKRKTDSWFVGFAPAENPKIAICVRLEFAGHGGEAAAPLAAKLVSKFLKLGPYSPEALRKASSAAVANALPSASP